MIVSLYLICSDYQPASNHERNTSYILGNLIDNVKDYGMRFAAYSCARKESLGCNEVLLVESTLSRMPN